MIHAISTTVLPSVYMSVAVIRCSASAVRPSSRSPISCAFSPARLKCKRKLEACAVFLILIACLFIALPRLWLDGVLPLAIDREDSVKTKCAYRNAAALHILFF